MVNIDEYFERKSRSMDDKRKENLRVIAEYRKRRQARLDARFRADGSPAYGIAISMGLDPSGMEPKEVWKMIKENKQGGKTEKSKATKQFSTKSGTSFPKLKNGATYFEDVLNTMEEEFHGKGMEKQFHDAVSKLTDNDVVYQHGKDGQVRACIPGLAAKIDHETVGKSESIQKKYDEAVRNAVPIATDMIDVCNKHGILLSGLENCAKTGHSYAKKIDTKHAEWDKARQYAKGRGEDPDIKLPILSDEEMADTFGDCIRFTMVSEHKGIAKNVSAVLDMLKSKGYTINELDNKYIYDKSDRKNRPTYKAIHIGVIAPTGEEFEIQVNSQEALDVKAKSHAVKVKQDDAKKARQVAVKNGDTAEAQKQDALVEQYGDEMREMWDKVPDPDGIWDLQSVPKQIDKKKQVVKRHNEANKTINKSTT